MTLWLDLSAVLESERIAYRQVGPILASGASCTEIDIVVPVDDWKKVPALVDRFTRSDDRLLLSATQTAQGTFDFLLGTCNDEGDLHYVRFSATSDLYVGPRRYIYADTLSNSPDSAGLEIAFHLLKSMSGGRLSEERLHRIARLLQSDRRDAMKWLSRFWNKADAALIVQYAESGALEILTAELARLRAAMIPPERLSVWAVAQEVRRTWQRLRHPSGVLLAVLGPDGSGKSLAIEGLTRELEDTLSAPLKLHFRPRFGKRQVEGLNCTNPHKGKPRGLLHSLLKIVYYTYDNALSYVGVIRPRLVQNQMVIFDRYFPDLLVDPIRYRYGGPAWSVKVLDFLVPKPDLLLVMDAPAAVIQKRTQEVTPEETMRQCEAYRDLGRRYTSVRLIDASRDPKHVARQARGVLLRHLEGAASRRLRKLGIAQEQTYTQPSSSL